MLLNGVRRPLRWNGFELRGIWRVERRLMGPFWTWRRQLTTCSFISIVVRFAFVHFVGRRDSGRPTRLDTEKLAPSACLCGSLGSRVIRKMREPLFSCFFPRDSSAADSLSCPGQILALIAALTNKMSTLRGHVSSKVTYFNLTELTYIFKWILNFKYAT